MVSIYPYMDLIGNRQVVYVCVQTIYGSGIRRQRLIFSSCLFAGFKHVLFSGIGKVQFNNCRQLQLFCSQHLPDLPHNFQKNFSLVSWDNITSLFVVVAFCLSNWHILNISYQSSLLDTKPTKYVYSTTAVHVTILRWCNWCAICVICWL